MGLVIGLCFWIAFSIVAGTFLSVFSYVCESLIEEKRVETTFGDVWIVITGLVLVSSIPMICAPSSW